MALLYDDNTSSAPKLIWDGPMCCFQSFHHRCALMFATVSRPSLQMLILQGPFKHSSKRTWRQHVSSQRKQPAVHFTATVSMQDPPESKLLKGRWMELEPRNSWEKSVEIHLDDEDEMWVDLPVGQDPKHTWKESQRKKIKTLKWPADNSKRTFVGGAEDHVFCFF